MTDAKHSSAARIMFVIAWLFAFLLLAIFFHYRSADQGSYVYSKRHGTLTIDADRSGHYWVTGTINQQPVRFLVDTGASLVSIPQALARQLRLKGSYPVHLNTAAGAVQGSLARVQELAFSGFVFNNVKVVIMPESSTDTVLLGMNVLSQFSITQKDRQLIIKR